MRREGQRVMEKLMLGETGRHGQVRVFNDIPAVWQGGESFCVAYSRVEEVALFLHCCSPGFTLL